MQEKIPDASKNPTDPVFYPIWSPFISCSHLLLPYQALSYLPIPIAIAIRSCTKASFTIVRWSSHYFVSDTT